MAIDTVYRLRLDFDVYNGDVIDTKEQEDKDQISIAKITQFIFDASVRLKLDACETSEGGPAHGPYCVLEHSDRSMLEQAENEIKRYVRRFKGHSLED
ncbi:hypothetical protein AAIE55_004084 [Salmonella enterica]